MKSDAQLFLEQVQKLDVRITNKLIEQRQWRDMALTITANMSADRVQSSGSKSRMADAIDKCVDMEADIDRLIDDLVDKKKEVIGVIEQLDSVTQYDVLHKRYIQFMGLQEIADHYGKDYGWATTTHGRALKGVQSILEKHCKV